MTDIIHVHIFDPSSRNLLFKQKASERSQLHIYTCVKHGECDAHKQGTCINVGNVFGAKCPVGKKRVTSGLTRRASGYYKQVSSWKETHSDKYNKLKSAPKRITKVPGGWMLPYLYMAMNEKVPFSEKEGLFNGGCPFISDVDMNPETFNSILSFRPQAMMGGTISAYQKESVTKFVKDFGDNYPDEFAVVSSGSERSKEILKNYNYVGRKAYLKTVKPNVKVKVSKSESWHWDGEKISREDEKIMIFEPIKWSKCYASFTPSDEATIEITSNDQVTTETKFAD